MSDFKVPTVPTAPASATNDKKETTALVESETKLTALPQEKTSNSVETVTLSTCPYKVPEWSSSPPMEVKYFFEVLKSGQIIGEVNDLQQQAFWTFGRLPSNDIEMAHPTISRFHAVLQYKPKTQVQNENIQSQDNAIVNLSSEQAPEGWYIYDLDSTHGTFLNKQRIPARIFIRIRVGHMLRLGASTRSYILQGPADDEEPESKLSVTELRAQHKLNEETAAAEAERKKVEYEEIMNSEGINWGLSEDADEETDLSHNPFASTNNEELFLDDPKRTLRGYFEREGLTLEYKCDEMSVGSFVCRVELPLDDERGKPIIAEIIHKGRKKECVVQCALEACRILDRHGVLRQASQEPLKRKQKSNESDSDDDEFWDRTGDIERRKQRKANTGCNIALTYEDLLKKEAKFLSDLEHVEKNIVKYQESYKRLKNIKGVKEQSDDDDLDAFMENLNEDAIQLDKTEIRKLRMEQQHLKTEQKKLQRLLKIAKPADLPFENALKNNTANFEIQKKQISIKKQLPIIGKRNQFSKFKVVKPLAKSVTEVECKYLASDEEEIEEDEITCKETDEMETEEHSETKIQETSSAISLGSSSSSSSSSSCVNEGKLPSASEIKPSILDFSNTTESSSDTNGLHGKPKEITDLSSASKFNEEITICDQNEENFGKKRSRQRQRVRNRRQEVDIDELEQHEADEKYSKWVPPENQTGDGYTKLNEKYGY